MLIGDFNEILLPNKVGGRDFSLSKAHLFADVLDDCGLMDIGSSGSMLNWCRTVQGRRKMAKRLDRALVDIQWHRVFLKAFLEKLM